MNLVRSLFLAGLSLAVAARAGEPPSTAPKTGGQILKEMAETYAGLSSYMDRGVVLSHDPAKSSPDQITFDTMFKRPNFYRFVWESHHPYEPLRHITRRNVVWSNERGAFGVFLGDFREGKPLMSHIAGATGVSRGSALTVIRMLLPKEITSATLSELSDPKLVGEEMFEGTLCYRVHGRNRRGDEYQLWIGKADLLLRRYLWPILGKTSEEIRRDIRINADLPRDVFEVNPADFPKTP